MKHRMIILIIFALAVSLVSAASFASDGEKILKVSITNITSGQTFTPIIIATHKKGVKLFTPGLAASEELAMIAEAGNTDPLAAMLDDNSKVGEITTTGGVLMPGETVMVEIPCRKRYNYISLAAMLLPTNDGFIALNGVKGPDSDETVMYLSPGYDAGSEENNESCSNIPGPFGCDGNGEGFNPADGEGYVHIHSGIHGIGDLDPADYDWKNPVARIVIKKTDMEDDDD